MELTDEVIDEIAMVEQMIHAVSTRSDMPNWTQIAAEIVAAVDKARKE